MPVSREHAGERACDERDPGILLEIERDPPALEQRRLGIVGRILVVVEAAGAIGAAEHMRLPGRMVRPLPSESLCSNAPRRT